MQGEVLSVERRRRWSEDEKLEIVSEVGVSDAGSAAVWASRRSMSGAVRIREAACWAHLCRHFHDVWTGTKSEIAREALVRIGALYNIEREM